LKQARGAALRAPAPQRADRIAAGSAPQHRPEHERLGQIVRDLAARHPRLLSPRWPEGRWLHGPLTRRLWLEGEIAVWLGALGPKLAAREGVGLARQLHDLRALAFDYRLEPRVYYMQALYRAPLDLVAPAVLGRYESKNWLFKALSRHRRRMRGDQPPYVSLNDKKEFARRCMAHGVPTPPLLLTASRGVITWHAERADLDRDLFVKQRHGRGARNTATFRRVSGLLYSDAKGRFMTLGAVMRFLSERSRKAKLIVQPRLANHPLLADVAGQSLAVVRVFTCLDRNDRPVVTHGMLRVLGKLEPAWPTVAEFGAPVDLATGRLGPMVGDKRALALDRHDRQPVTGAEIAGRILPHWPAIMVAARAAHGAHPERTVVGWDIALSPDGPVVLEGNSRPDVAFLQRAHDVPIGLSPLAPLLLDHVRALERSLAQADGD
jgi:hypothetical protein